MLPNLKAEMARVNIGAADVGIVAGVSDRTVRNWLRGESQPTIGQAIAIRRSLFPSLTEDYLFEGAPCK